MVTLSGPVRGRLLPWDSRQRDANAEGDGPPGEKSSSELQR